MPKPHPTPDPMAGVVDRLLAQLPGLQQETAREPGRVNGFRTAPQSVGTGSWQVRLAPPTQAQIIGAWIRLVLALSLGMMMAMWPYARSCGMPLAGYLGALACVMWAGVWAAKASWRYRISLAHVLSLTVFLYGFTLTMAELLPRTGYAVDHAFWECVDSAAPASLAAQSDPSAGIRLQ